jgi:hypothetical protein
LALPADVVLEAEPESEPGVLDEPDVPEVPDVPDEPDVAVPGRLAVAWAARALKAARVLFEDALEGLSAFALLPLVFISSSKRGRAALTLH